MPALLSNSNRRVAVWLCVIFIAGFALILPARHSPIPSLSKFNQLPQYIPPQLQPWRWIENLPKPEHVPNQPLPARLASNLTFRQRLEAADNYEHSTTLTFSHIYVVSLPSRTDRRQIMSRLASALGLRITFVDAELKESDLIKWIGERVYDIRQRKRQPLAQALGVAPDDVGGMGIGAIWLARPGQNGSAAELFLPSAQEPQWQGQTWTQFLHNEEEKIKDAAEDSPARRESPLRPVDPDVNITTLLWDPIETMDRRQIRSGVLSTWHSHLKAMKAMAANADDSALVLEDDVDIEWDIERLWTAIHRKLPPDWDMVYLGHCWGREMTSPTRAHPSLHNTYAPRCLHAYALSKMGYTKMIDFLSEPWSAYQAPVDVAIPTLIIEGSIKSFSVDPPLIIQAKTSESDIQIGTGDKWRGLLGDSTMDRIWRDEGKSVKNLNWITALRDPAVVKPHIANQVF